jgi:hypothetical protein
VTTRRSQLVDQFVAGVAGRAGAGAVAKVGGWTKGAEVARAGAYLTGDMFNALGIVTDRNVDLVRTPPLEAYEVKEVVSKSPIGSTEVAWAGRSRLEIGDYYMTCTARCVAQSRLSDRRRRRQRGSVMRAVVGDQPGRPHVESAARCCIASNSRETYDCAGGRGGGGLVRVGPR